MAWENIFDKQWQNAGTEPADAFFAEEGGYQAGVKPPAQYFNWFWHNTIAAISELQGKITYVDSIEEFDSVGNGLAVYNGSATNWYVLTLQFTSAVKTQLRITGSTLYARTKSGSNAWGAWNEYTEHILNSHSVTVTHLRVKSSTPDSNRIFEITVDDDGNISATRI